MGRRDNCLALGFFLGLDQEAMAHVNNLPSAHYWEGDAYDMLNKWLRKAPESSGLALHRALVEINKDAIAEEFASVLLAAGKLRKLLGFWNRQNVTDSQDRGHSGDQEITNLG